MVKILHRPVRYLEPMPSPEEVAAAVARNLRAQRTQRGWTLDTLATRAGVSKGMLVQIEQQRTNPSIATLCRLSDALGIALGSLVEVAETPVVRVVAADEVVTLWHGPAGGRGNLLLGADPPTYLELWDWRLAAGEAHDGEAHPPGSRELLAVLEGALVVGVDGADHRVEAGGAVLFRADRPHRYAAGGPGGCRFVMAVSQPPPEP